MSTKIDWQNHQNLFLNLTLAEVKAFESRLRPEISDLIAAAKPMKSLSGRLSLLSLKLRNRDLYERRLKIENQKGLHFASLEQIQNEFNGKSSDNTPDYSHQIREFEAEQKSRIHSGKSISPFLPDFEYVEYDQIKLERLLDLFNPSAFNVLGLAMAQTVICSKPGDLLESAEVVMLASVITRAVGGMVKDKFEDINEVDAYTEIEKLHKSAGNSQILIPSGTSCTHAGLLDAVQTLNDDLPCFTTTDPNKINNYTGWAVTEHFTNPKPGFVPQVISASVNSDLRSAVMTGTSFSQFKLRYCQNRNELCKEFIKFWADGRFEALSGTNLGDDELLIIKPASHLSVISSTPIQLPASQIAKASSKQKPSQPPSP